MRLEAAAADTADPALRDEILAADQEVDRLADTVDRMLMIAKEVEEGHASPVDLRDVADRAATRWHARAADAGTSVTVDGPRGSALADPVDLDQIVDNLIDNALAYAKGPIQIETARRAGVVSLSVRDHGPGIPPGDLEHVADRFYRGETADHTGSGLGLAIARELAERWGGHLLIGNDEDAGARIEVELPSADASSA